MFRNQIDENTGFAAQSLVRRGSDISTEGFLTCERIKEIMMICARQDPIYEQISSFSIALYTLGYFDSPDLMSLQDVDLHRAAEILKDEFTPIASDDLPADYNIAESADRYLLVIGDPLFPLHFAVFTDGRSERPFFSKLPLFGSGFDSLPELMDEFAGYDGIPRHDIHYFKKKQDADVSPSIQRGKIYIVKD